MNSFRRRLRNYLSRPLVGAPAVFASMRPQLTAGVRSRRLDLIQSLFRYSGWYFVAVCALIAFIPTPNKRQVPLISFGIVLSIYAAYTIVLEFASRVWRTAYDHPFFRAVRITASMIAVTALVALDPRGGSYFWFFYLLPALQAFIYFGRPGVIVVDSLIVVAYVTASLGTAATIPGGGDYLVVGLNVLILLFASGVLSGFFTALHVQRTVGTTLQRISGKVIASLTLSEALQVTLTEGTNAIGATGGSVMLWSPVDRKLHIEAWIEDGDFDAEKSHRTFGWGEGIAGVVIATGQVINVPDVTDDSRFSPSFTNREIRSLLAVPIFSGGHPAGTICVDSPSIGHFQREAEGFLAALADYLGIALESQRLRNVANALSTLRDDQALQQLVEDAAAMTGADSATLFLKDPDSGAVIRKARFPDKVNAEGPRTVGGLTATVLATAESVIIGDASVDPRVRESVVADGVRSILGVPLATPMVGTAGKGRVIGVLFVNSQKLHLFSRRDETLLRDMSARAAVDIDKASLYGETQWRLEQLLTLQEVSASIHSERSVETLLNLISERATKLLGGDSGAILLRDDSGEYLRIRGSYGLSPRTVDGVRIRVGEGFAGRAVNSEDAVIADDIPTDERTINPYLKEEGILAIISVRLKTLNGNAIGTLGVHSRTRTHAFRTRHADILRLLASQAVAAIANASSLEPTLRKAREATTLETLFKESVELTRPKRLPDLIHSILRTAVETLKSDGGGLYLCDTPGGDARLVEVVGLPEIEKKTTTPVGTGVVGEVIRTNAPLTVSNYSSWPNRMARFDTYGFSAVAGAPIRWQDEARGAIAVHSIREGRSYSEEDLKVLSLLGAFAAVALENARRSDEYDRLFDSSLDAIVVIDDRGHVTNINPQAERVFGRPKDALRGRSVVELYANIDDPKLIKQALLRAPHGRIEDYPTSVRNLTSGVTIPISLSASLLMDDDRTVTGSVGFFRDLRELKSAQRELSLLRGVLSASRATTQISDWKRVLAVIVATVESTVGARGVVLSPCAEGQIRLAESAISPAFATSLDATTLPRQTLEQIMRAQEVIEGRGFFDGSSGSTHAGPRDIWLGCPLKIGESVLGVIVGVYDEGHAITDKERALFQLFADVAAIAINNADQASELESVAWTSALASWHASLAHDLDDEVRAIRWRLDGLQARPELPEDVKAELHRIDANAEAIALPIRRTRNRGADLLECIRREIDLARKRRPDIAWDVMPTDVSPQVVLGADWTRRIVRNFFRNAAAAMPPAWPTRRMVVTVSQNGEQAICRFEDCGRGLPVELEPIIFRRLVRHDQSMGSGLLLISSTLKQHGGSARLVSNRVGLGACFEIQIPLFGIDKRLPPRSGAQTSNPTW